MKDSGTLTECLDVYLNQGKLYSAHTRSAYARAVALFFEFLTDRTVEDPLPIQQLRQAASQLSPADFTSGDERIFAAFREWLASVPTQPRKGDKRPYSEATIALRLAGVQHFFSFLDRRGWLASEFNVAIAIQYTRTDVINTLPATPIKSKLRQKQVGDFPDLSGIITYYDRQQPPAYLQGDAVDPERLERWQLVRLRNRGLLHCLAETGGRVSELLRLNVVDIQDVMDNEQATIAVRGKNEHMYEINITMSRRQLADYIKARQLAEHHTDTIPLFISHDLRYAGNRMSRIVAWRVVRRAAQSMGMGNISPHDFRHWRAYQLIREGKPLEEIRDALGHRSVETVKSLYEHLLT